MGDNGLFASAGGVVTCSQNPARNSCKLITAEEGEYDAIAGVRMILSCLSIIGTLTIIILAIGKRQVFKFKVHPIFILSLADFILACLWIIGGTLWLRRVENKMWCLVVSLTTIILQCITINLTLIYAILAYRSLRNQQNSANQSLLNKQGILDEEENLLHVSADKVWKKSVIIGVYTTAWFTPVFLVMVAFGIVVADSSDIVKKIGQCSCWCLPTYGNVLPYAYSRDVPTAVFMHDMHKLLSSYGCVVGFHYLIVFILLVIIYRKILKLIKTMRQQYEQTHSAYRYGVATTIIVNKQSEARTRIVLYLLVFLINGFFNFLLSLALIAFETFYLGLPEKRINHDSNMELLGSPYHKVFMVLLTFQSLTLPIQGFMNAIVYGWTRRDFVDTMAISPEDLRTKETVPFVVEQEVNTSTPATGTGKKMLNSSLLLSQRLATSADIIQSTEIEVMTDGYDS